MRTSRWKGDPILLGCFLALIAITAWEAASSHAGYTVTMAANSESGEGREILIRDGRLRLAIEARGEIEMTPDERGIERLGAGAYLEIDEKHGRERRRLEATPGPGGVPEIAWFVDRERTEFDDDGEKWLARALKKLYRVSGHDAEGRVERLLAAGGVSPVLREISRISADGVARVYFEQLFAKAELSDKELARALRQMAREVDSDNELGRLMPLVPAARLANENIVDAWLRATDSIGSDFTLRKVLGAVAQRPDASAPALGAVLEASLGIGSDHELGSLLRQLAGVHPIDPAMRPAFDRALATIGSDHERERVLTALSD